MEIQVRGKNVDLARPVRAVTREKLGKLPRFARDIDRVEVEYSEIRNPRVADNQLCEVTVHLKRHVLKAHAAASEQLAALDAVIDKAEHQVSRLKEKRIGRSHPRRSRLAQRPPDVEPWEPEPVPAGANGDAAHDVPGDVARVVRKKQFAARPMDVDDAALQMDLLGHDFYLFTNVETGLAAVLYRRHDGHLGLIESVP
jgi:ribosomal subunit interface protein